MKLSLASRSSTIILTSVLVTLGLATPRSVATPHPMWQAASANSETPAMFPPPVLFIQREVIAKGKMGDQNEVARKILKQYQDHHIVFHLLGMTSMIPNRDEIMVMVNYQSFAEIDEIGKQFSAQPADFLDAIGELRGQEDALAASKNSMLAVFRPDLSYRADSSAMARARLLWVDQFVVPQGHMPDYESDVKFMKASAAKINMDEHYFVYQTVAGAESQTLIVIRALKSLADWDKSAETAAALDRVLDDAGKKRLARLWQGNVVQGPGQSLEKLYNLRPDLSMTSDQFAAFDPDFWRPKAQ
jgi:hypothetical protein